MSSIVITEPESYSVAVYVLLGSGKIKVRLRSAGTKGKRRGVNSTSYAPPVQRERMRDAHFHMII